MSTLIGLSISYNVKAIGNKTVIDDFPANNSVKCIFKGRKDYSLGEKYFPMEKISLPEILACK